VAPTSDRQDVTIAGTTGIDSSIAYRAAKAGIAVKHNAPQDSDAVNLEAGMAVET
jgi:hypothetical protein